MRLQAITRSRKCPARPAAIGARKPDSLAHGKYDPEYSFGRNPDLVVSCRARAVVSSAPRRLAEFEHPQADYAFSILASEPFRSHRGR